MPSRAVLVSLALALAAALALAGWLVTGPPGREPPLSTTTVDSFWDEARLRCRTTTVRLDLLDLEVFRCRPAGGPLAPAGRYTELDTTWQSDVDRRTALRHDIVITPSGTLRGWAVYPPDGG